MLLVVAPHCRQWRLVLEPAENAAPTSRHLSALCSPPDPQATHEALFDPPLPAEKAAVIARMGFGVINKVYIVSDAPEQQVPARLQLIRRPSAVLLLQEHRIGS